MTGVAGINALAFQVGVLPKIKPLGVGADVPPAAKLVAAFSLFLWVGVKFLGRMLPYLGEAF